jgi:D-psicose/D-tagatose/L-ribulose 3-epimerase
MANIGITTWIWTAPLTTAEFERIAPHIKQLGFDTVEVPIEGLSDLDYRRASHLLRDLGLGSTVCAAMGPDRDLIHADPQIRANGLAYVRHCIDAAHTLKARHVLGPLYSAVGRTWQATDEEREKDVELLVRQLRDLSTYAGTKGVGLCIEPLNRFETSFLNLASQAVEVVDRVNHPACRILLDTFHMNIEETSIGDAIRAAGPRLGQVHTCENDRGAPGSGHVPWQEVAGALRDIKFDGPLVIESFTPKVKTIAKAAAIWRPLASSPDALATNGLKFLRALMG